MDNSKLLQKSNGFLGGKIGYNQGKAMQGQKGIVSKHRRVMSDLNDNKGLKANGSNVASQVMPKQSLFQIQSKSKKSLKSGDKSPSEGLKNFNFGSSLQISDIGSIEINNSNNNSKVNGTNGGLVRDASGFMNQGGNKISISDFNEDNELFCANYNGLMNSNEQGSLTNKTQQTKSTSGIKDQQSKFTKGKLAFAKHSRNFSSEYLSHCIEQGNNKLFEDNKLKSLMKSTTAIKSQGFNANNKGNSNNGSRSCNSKDLQNKQQPQPQPQVQQQTQAQQLSQAQQQNGDSPEKKAILGSLSLSCTSRDHYIGLNLNLKKKDSMGMNEVFNTKLSNKGSLSFRVLEAKSDYGNVGGSSSPIPIVIKSSFAGFNNENVIHVENELQKASVSHVGQENMSSVNPYKEKQYGSSEIGLSSKTPGFNSKSSNYQTLSSPSKYVNYKSKGKFFGEESKLVKKAVSNLNNSQSIQGKKAIGMCKSTQIINRYEPSDGYKADNSTCKHIMKVSSSQKIQPKFKINLEEVINNSRQYQYQQHSYSNAHHAHRPRRGKANLKTLISIPGDYGQNHLHQHQSEERKRSKKQSIISRSLEPTPLDTKCLSFSHNFPTEIITTTTAAATATLTTQKGLFKATKKFKIDLNNPLILSKDNNSFIECNTNTNANNNKTLGIVMNKNHSMNEDMTNSVIIISKNLMNDYQEESVLSCKSKDSSSGGGGIGIGGSGHGIGNIGIGGSGMGGNGIGGSGFGSSGNGNGVVPKLRYITTRNNSTCSNIEGLGQEITVLSNYYIGQGIQTKEYARANNNNTPNNDISECAIINSIPYLDRDFYRPPKNNRLGQYSGYMNGNIMRISQKNISHSLKDSMNERTINEFMVDGNQSQIEKGNMGMIEEKNHKQSGSKQHIGNNLAELHVLASGLKGNLRNLKGVKEAQDLNHGNMKKKKKGFHKKTKSENAFNINDKLSGVMLGQIPPKPSIENSMVSILLDDAKSPSPRKNPPAQGQSLCFLSDDGKDDNVLREKLIRIIKKTFTKHGLPPSTTLDFYRLIKMIGKGAFGKVYLGIHLLTGRYVAIKSIEKQYIQDEVSRRKVLQEVSILQKICHGNVIKLLEVFENQKYLFMVFENAACGDLLSYVKQKGSLSEDEAKRIFIQIVEGIKYCHSLDILHRDIKLDNVLLDVNDVVKICDFGVSRFIKKGQVINEQCGTPAYIAPEIIKDQGYEGCYADLWSMGVLLFTMVTGNVPFKANNIKELHTAIINGVFTIPNYLSEGCRDLICSFLKQNPYMRIDIKDVANHPWFKDMQYRVSKQQQQQSQGSKLQAPYDKKLHDSTIMVMDLFTSRPNKTTNTQATNTNKGTLRIIESIVQRVEILGYPKDYILDSLNQNSCTHVFGTYYLLYKNFIQNGML